MEDFWSGFGAGILALGTTTLAAHMLQAAYQRRRELRALERAHRLQRAEEQIPARDWPPDVDPPEEWASLDPLGLTTLPAGAWGTDGTTYWTADDILRQEG